MSLMLLQGEVRFSRLQKKATPNKVQVHDRKNFRLRVQKKENEKKERRREAERERERKRGETKVRSGGRREEVK